MRNENEILENNVREDLDHFYHLIKAHGWIIDVRSVRPTLIKRGTQWARTFETQEAAIMYALEDMRKAE